MSDLLAYAAQLVDAGAGRRPAPVHKWNPAYCGELDLTIRRDGVWVHEGTPIGRAPLVRLFASVLKREGDRYFLVTPAEKLGIKVEDAPFLAPLVDAEEAANGRRLLFTTNVGDKVAAGPARPVEYREIAGSGQKAPYVLVRDELWARVTRAAFYDLVDYGETRDVNGVDTFGVQSEGVFFPFAPAAEVFE
jgi:hypothetical protein